MIGGGSNIPPLFRSNYLSPHAMSTRAEIAFMIAPLLRVQQELSIGVLTPMSAPRRVVPIKARTVTQC
jgi:hypothetical protein